MLGKQMLVVSQASFALLSNSTNQKKIQKGDEILWLSGEILSKILVKEELFCTISGNLVFVFKFWQKSRKLEKQL